MMTSTSADLALFAHVVLKPEADLDLVQGALLVAEAEYPNLDIPHYVSKLDELARGARERLRRTKDAAPIDIVVRYLYEEIGFCGNEGDYYDPRNSFLNEVLDRRTGIPITLALVLTEVCRRAGVEAAGISFPGHFLVRVVDTDGDAMILDPFDGRLMDERGLLQLYARATGREELPEPGLLEPASKSQVLLRLLNNLRSIYAERGDGRRHASVVERMLILDPGLDREELKKPVPPIPALVN